MNPDVASGSNEEEAYMAITKSDCLPLVLLTGPHMPIPAGSQALINRLQAPISAGSGSLQLAALSASAQTVRLVTVSLRRSSRPG